MRSTSDSRAALAAVLIVIAAYAFAFFALMRQRQHDISWFVVAGGAGVDPDRIPAGLSIIPDVEGYDGIAFYRLAIDPFTTQSTAFGITLDAPPYRQQRVLFPLLVHLLSFGRVEWIPTLLVLVNLLAISGLTVGAATVARQYGLHPLWSLLVPLYPGFFIAFSRDTCEIVAAAFVVSSLAAFGARHWKVGSALLCAAVLSRETTLLVVAGMASVYAGQVVLRRSRSFPAFVFVLPVLVYAGWQLVLRSWWGMSGLEAGGFEPVVPFSGAVSLFIEAAARRTVLMRVHFAECVFWALVIGAVSVAIARTTAPLQWRLAWIAYLGLAAILGREVWGDHHSFMRVLGELYVMSAVLLFGARPAARWLVLLSCCSLSFYVVSHLR